MPSSYKISDQPRATSLRNYKSVNFMTLSALVAFYNPCRIRETVKVTRDATQTPTRGRTYGHLAP